MGSYLNQKYPAANFPSDSSKIRPSISPRKNGSEITIATQDNEKTTH